MWEEDQSNGSSWFRVVLLYFELITCLRRTDGRDYIMKRGCTRKLSNTTSGQTIGFTFDVHIRQRRSQPTFWQSPTHCYLSTSNNSQTFTLFLNLWSLSLFLFFLKIFFFFFLFLCFYFFISPFLFFSVSFLVFYFFQSFSVFVFFISLPLFSNVFFYFSIFFYFTPLFCN